MKRSYEELLRHLTDRARDRDQLAPYVYSHLDGVTRYATDGYSLAFCVDSRIAPQRTDLGMQNACEIYRRPPQRARHFHTTVEALLGWSEDPTYDEGPENLADECYATTVIGLLGEQVLALPALYWALRRLPPNETNVRVTLGGTTDPVWFGGERFTYVQMPRSDDHRSVKTRPFPAALMRDHKPAPPQLRLILGGDR